MVTKFISEILYSKVTAHLAVTMTYNFSTEAEALWWGTPVPHVLRTLLIGFGHSIGNFVVVAGSEIGTKKNKLMKK